MIKQRKFIYVNILFSLIFFTALPSQKNDVYIVVHGTWSCGCQWANPGGDFFDALQLAVSPATVVPYTWNGNNSHNSRVHAAQGLAELIKSYAFKTNICIAAHSHGANVGMLASQILTKSAHDHFPITAFYALGAPVNITSYSPNMEAIQKLYNIFSFEDMVQPVLNMFGRVYPAHPRIANIRLFIQNKEPGHAELHCPFVAALLPSLEPLLCKQDEPSGSVYLENKNGYVAAYFEPDDDREHMLERDQTINQMLLASFSRRAVSKN